MRVFSMIHIWWHQNIRRKISRIGHFQPMALFYEDIGANNLYNENVFKS